MEESAAAYPAGTGLLLHPFLIISWASVGEDGIQLRTQTCRRLCVWKYWYLKGEPVATRTLMENTGPQMIAV